MEVRGIQGPRALIVIFLSIFNFFEDDYYYYYNYDFV